MANIKDLKKKIRSTQSTSKITTAMKLVSAAKLNKAQQAISGARPYANELDETIKTISALVQDYNHAYFNKSKNKKSLILVISSDKGLCGGYNVQLTKKIDSYLNGKEDDYKLYFIGKKAKELLKTKASFGKTITFEKSEPTFSEFSKLVDELSYLFTSGEYGKVFVAYNSFNSAISFTSNVKQVLPMELNPEDKTRLNEEFPFDFKYEPKPSIILDTLVPQALTSTVWTAQLDALASEHGSRMAAMDNASKNCKELIRTLTLKMNKLRQAGITTELIEVVSGAESLNN
jgi:F-type H+-transporting ATPase subunit gamma